MWLIDWLRSLFKPDTEIDGEIEMVEEATEEHKSDDRPLGVRLNNPGNIKRTNIRWFDPLGRQVLQSNDTFLAFSSPVWGLRAMMKIIINYGKKYDLKTIAQITHRYAPPSENNTTAYAEHVSWETGWDMNTPVDPIRHRETFIHIIQVMVEHENGTPQGAEPEYWYPREVYEEALDYALGDKPLPK